MNFSHVAINVDDIDKAAEYFTDVLGFKVQSPKQLVKELNVEVMFLSDGHTPFRLELYKRNEGKKPNGSFDHFGLEVENLENAIREAKGAGLSLESGPHQISKTLRLAFLKSLDYGRVEFLERQG